MISDVYVFPNSSVGKESACNTGDPDLIPGLGRSPGKGICYPLQYLWASLVAQMVKHLSVRRRPGFYPWVGKIPWKRAWQPTPVFSPGESSWTEEPGGYSPWGCKDLDTTKHGVQASELGVGILKILP